MKKFGKSTNILKLNTTLLNNSWVKEEITQEIRKYFETYENKNNIQNLWNAVKAVH